jgi:hypothetical protein
MASSPIGGDAGRYRGRCREIYGEMQGYVERCREI